MPKDRGGYFASRSILAWAWPYPTAKRPD